MTPPPVCIRSQEKSALNKVAECKTSGPILTRLLKMRACAKVRHGQSMAAGNAWPGVTEIIPGLLWLGDEDDACDEAWLSSVGITHILNCANKSAKGCVRSRQYFELGAQDEAEYDLLGSHFPAAQGFLDEIMQSRCDGGGQGQYGAGGGGGHYRSSSSSSEGGVGACQPARVLVHCVAGVNRSAAITIAYLMTRGAALGMFYEGKENDENADCGNNVCCDPTGMPLVRAAQCVFEKRPIVLRNDTFVMQLVKMEVQRQREASGNSRAPRAQ